MLDCEIIKTDVLIVGAGAAGITAAIRAYDEGVKVLLITSGPLGRDSATTWMAGGGFQCALYPPDSHEVHAQDTIRNGQYLSNQELVYTLLKEAPICVTDVEKWGEKLHKKGDRFVQSFLPGHTYARCLQREKEKGVSRFGEEHHKILPHAIRAREIPVLEDFLVTDLLRAEGRVIGAAGINLRDGEFRIIQSKVVIVATGGYCACYTHYLTGPLATGWGHGMAYRAGAEFIDMEFVDFYPYAALWPKLSTTGEWPAMLRYGLSGKFYNRDGFEFWERYRRKGFTRPRAIFKEVGDGRGSPRGGIYLAANHLPTNLIDNFVATQQGSTWLKELNAAGFDIHSDAVEVYISVMSTLGGCKVDTHCKTRVPGLYAAGELASGFDGAHTLAGNMMTFCFASGSVAGRKATEEAKVSQMIDIDESQMKSLRNKVFAPLEREEGMRPIEIKKQIKEIMWDFCNVAGRTKEGLETAVKAMETLRLDKLPRLYSSAKNKRFNLEWAECLEVENMLAVSEMTLRGALTRSESRGLHFREDFPQLDPNLTKTIVISKREEGMSISMEEVAFPHLKPKEA